jgi:hypothetical protein
MPHHKQLPEPWRPFLMEMDEAVAENIRFECLGGFVITALYGLPRPTADIDVLTTTAIPQGLIELAGHGSPLHRKYKVYLDPVGVANIPENYDERLTEIFPGALRRIRLFALDPYDLALSKLERNIQRDRDDVKFLAKTVPFDIQLLRNRYQKELRWQLGNPEREDLTLKLWIEAIQETRAQQ